MANSTNPPTPMVEMHCANRYREELRNIPASGGGGCHVALLRVANYGRLAGASPDQVAADLASHVHGTRRVTASEITNTVNKAFNSQSTFTPHIHMRTATPAPKVDGAKLLAGIVERGADGACKNEARLSRMPGHFRAEKSRWQRVLYLNPTGGQVIP